MPLWLTVTIATLLFWGVCVLLLAIQYRCAPRLEERSRWRQERTAAKTDRSAGTPDRPSPENGLTGEFEPRQNDSPEPNSPESESPKRLDDGDLHS
ncbi:hypothetical protein FYK55_05270 [Roseiconus nitratireducens]|uniref:Uncharacterized protein n=1 Tax=Roseiconus nitratireducens TaxID=2605748 RepID=A0A5M6DIV9_9BACT|nr:hypothetical protein [Roseiconus nitratireducens]KAA5546296.1 hypothetical protein FYK55_05270 [Roseiconus nitratireducens]